MKIPTATITITTEQLEQWMRLPRGLKIVYVTKQMGDGDIKVRIHALDGRGLHDMLVRPSDQRHSRP